MPPSTLDFSRRADLTEMMDEPCSRGGVASLPARSREAEPVVSGVQTDPSLA